MEDREEMNHKIMPTTYFWILLLLSVGSHFIFPVRTVIKSPFTYFGTILIGIGIVLNIWTDILFKKLNTTVKPHEYPTTLITSGPFSITRHPMYLGMAGALLGLSVLLGSLITFISPILFVSLMELLFIPLEEENLEKIFNLDYLEYKKKVRRWI